MWSMFIASSMSSVSPCVDSLVKATPSWSGGKIGLRWEEAREKFRCFWIPVGSSVCVCKWSHLPHRWVGLTFKQSNNAKELIDSSLDKTGISRNSLIFSWIVIIRGLCCIFLTSSAVDRGDRGWTVVPSPWSMWNTEAGVKVGRVPFEGVCNMVCVLRSGGREQSSVAPSCEAAPGACRDCGMWLMWVWVEAGDSKSPRHAAVNLLSEEGVCPHVPTVRSLLGVNLCVFASVHQPMVFLPITRKRTVFKLISCLRA